ncbi:cyclic GMP-AMP synthase [Trichonephila clavipes]|nr:cyclic GMP-AMP synthase [Trichonephila clavipes]
MDSCNYEEVLQFVFSKGKLKLEIQLDGIYSQEFKRFCIGKSEAFKNLFQGYYYTGSYFEGLRVSEATEFDVNTVFSIPSNLEYWLPCLKEARAPCIAVEMECVKASGTSSAGEAARRLGLPPSSVRNILC